MCKQLSVKSSVTNSILWRGLSRHNGALPGRRWFFGRKIMREFLKTLAEAHVLWGVEVFAYSLMSNHYHVCLRTPKGNLSQVMRQLYTQRFNRSHGRDGSLFRGRYRGNFDRCGWVFGGDGTVYP